MDFCELLFYARLTDNKKAGAVLGVSERTIRRYKNGTSKPSALTIRFLLIIAGSLEHIEPKFEGWTIKNGELYASNGEHFSVTRLEHIRTEFAFIRDYKNRIKELEQELDELKAMLPNADVIPLHKTMKK